MTRRATAATDPETSGEGLVDRPPVTIIVPFHGPTAAGVQMLEAFEPVELRGGDELLVADNTDEQVVAALASERGARAVPALGHRSSYFARNAAAEQASNEWLLFIDADCRPVPRIVDEYFAEPVGTSCGAIAGEVVAATDQESLVARYARSRRHLRQDDGMNHPYKPVGVTANLLVRREGWLDVGGFLEGIRSAGDSDFCWRLQDRGWRIEYRRRAVVEHRHREDVRGLARQMARYGAGRRWLTRRHPGSRGRPRPFRDLARCGAGIVAWTVTGRFERARFKMLDAVAVLAESGGYLLANTPPAAAGENANAGSDPTRYDLDLVVLVDTFPLLSETFITTEAHALKRLGHRVRVLAGGRAARPNRQGARGLEVNYLEDDGIARRVLDLAWLVTRHPARCLRDLAGRFRWRREEPVRALGSLAPAARRLARQGRPHLHAHFAAGAALDALRLSRLLGLTYSVTAHAYDIFQTPRNLREKLERADLVTTGCRYNVDHLRQVVGPGHGERIHEIVMGVDGERFRRASPYPGGRNVLAVGRLVEKKGFAYLIEAAALIARDQTPERITIVGEGPQRASLAELARRRGVGDLVDLAGARDPDAVRALLETTDLLVMPCVVAADGDRDSMPVVVKEALAMEVPVVATDEVGLPEVVRSEWGRLVPPADPEALAAAIVDVLDLAPAVRSQMGRAGRAWVLERCSADGEAAKLAQLLNGVGDGAAG